jgi:hypothetical protein
VRLTVHRIIICIIRHIPLVLACSFSNGRWRAVVFASSALAWSEGGHYSEFWRVGEMTQKCAGWIFQSLLFHMLVQMILGHAARTNTYGDCKDMLGATLILRPYYMVLDQNSMRQ